MTVVATTAMTMERLMSESDASMAESGRATRTIAAGVPFTSTLCAT